MVFTVSNLEFMASNRGVICNAKTYCNHCDLNHAFIHMLSRTHVNKTVVTTMVSAKQQLNDDQERTYAWSLSYVDFTLHSIV